MVDITDAHRTDYDRMGFTLIENAIPAADLKTLQADVGKLWAQAKQKKITKIRVYDDLPHFLGGLNVAGIEDPFYHSIELKNWLLSSPLDRIIAEVTRWPGARLELARLHMNDRFKYQGFWHRDAKPSDSETNVVAIVYLYDEAGFKIMPSDSEFSAPNNPLGDEIQAQHHYGPLDGEHTIEAPAGSVFLMKSYLLHRGYNNKPRMHLHTRFVRDKGFDLKAWSEYRNMNVSDYKTSSTPLQRTRVLASYLTPGKNKSSIFQR